MGRFAAKAILIAVLTLLVAEATLQLASLVTRQLVSRGEGDDAAAGAITILCVGDSHTYGLPLPAEDSYPAQLEAVLRQRHPDRAIRVVNLGIPSLNSAFVANRLERQILQLQPRLVIVWVGVNNRWNFVEADAWLGEDRWAGVRQKLMASRLFRLASLVWVNSVGEQYDTQRRGGLAEGEVPFEQTASDERSEALAGPGLAHDLRRMAETSRSLSTPLMFVTYPLPRAKALNRIIRGAAGEMGVPVIESDKVRANAQRMGHDISELVDTRQGTHPSRLLYGFVVQAMLPEVEAAIGLRAGPNEE